MSEEKTTEGAEETEVRSLYSIEGYQCLKPPRSISPAKAVRLIQRVESSGGDAVDQGATLLEVLEAEAVVDREQYQNLFVRKGLEHIITLAEAWVGELLGGRR